MTNLIAMVTVCIVTNVTHWNNEVRVPGDSSGLMWGQVMPVIKEATERTETTEVVETRTLSFAWEGEARTMTKQTVLSRNVRRWERSFSWTEVLVAPPITCLTNLCVTNACIELKVKP